VPIETARGCWWGQEKPCWFCGLNGLSTSFRSKSPDRAIAEIDHVVERYAPDVLFATDRIFDRSYFETVVPHLRENHPDLCFAYELRAPVTRGEMQALGEAGIDLVTVGIESLSTRALTLMDKGTTYLENVHCLRLAAEFGVEVGWQFLYRFPGEVLEDYEEVANEVAWLLHLSPPDRACVVTLARFSPFFDRADELRISRICAHQDYRLCFPWPQRDLDRVACYFDFEPDDGRDEALTPRVAELLRAVTKVWQARHSDAKLDLYRGTALAAVIDTRLEPPAVFLLSGRVLLIHDALDAPANLAQVAGALKGSVEDSEDLLGAILGFKDDRDARVLRLVCDACRRLGVEAQRIPDPFPDGSLAECARLEELVRGVLDTLVETGLARTEAGRYLALAVPRQPSRSGGGVEVVSEVAG
jgi:ribosomal peptide maturation radical SAM protein 1